MSKEKTNKPGYGKILDAWAPPEDAGESIGCVATSFTFSPPFFEEECLGRFLQLMTNVADGPAYLIEREEKLAQLRCAAALVDQHHANGVRNLRWDLLPARLPKGILHAKVSLLLWSRCARLIVASANLTDCGYRHNHEVFAALDYFDGSEAPLSVLDETLAFLREAVSFAQPVEGTPGPAVARWLGFLDRVSVVTRAWGMQEPPRALAKPRVLALFVSPKRASAFDSLKDLWPDNSPPERAFVISPFFDPPEVPNEPARQIWNLLRQRGAAAVEYHVIAEGVPGEQAVLVHAPASLVAQPANRGQVETIVQRLQLEDGRPLHAKCLRLESDRFILHLIGSSNFTSAGLGLSKTKKNLEANLVFIVGQQNSDTKKALRNAWLPVEEIPDNIERRWQPRPDEGEDSANGELLALHPAFADASFGFDKKDGAYVEFTFAGAPPASWSLFPEDEAAPFVTEREWHQRGRPTTLSIPWPRSRPPSSFKVTWGDSGGYAWWPVNVLDSDALPLPDDLKDLPLDVLIEILTSAKPLHLALARWLKRNRTDSPDAVAVALDPHKRVDTSAFLLQRTRRLSWALSALRQRLERPVVSEQALTWRLRGPVGVLALAQAIDKEAQGHSELERCFLLTELCLELTRVRPEVVPGSLSKAVVCKALRELIVEIRVEISPAALAGEQALAAYITSVFEEVGA